MIGTILLLSFLDFLFWVLFTAKTDNVYFNPIENYETWSEMNWFGVWVCTILYWILFLPVSIVCGVAAGVYVLFTVGRR